MKTKLITLIIFSIIVLIGLNSCETSTESKNNPPEIKEIVLNKSSISTGEYVYITAIAIDTDGDSLQYFWFTSEGEVIYTHINTNPTRWRAPSEEGTYTVSCSVSDGKSLDTKSLDIIVKSG